MSINVNARSALLKCLSHSKCHQVEKSNLSSRLKLQAFCLNAICDNKPTNLCLKVNSQIDSI